MRKALAITLVFIATLLSGCVFVAGGAVIASAAYVAHDHRSLTQARNDHNQQQQIVTKLNASSAINQPNTYIYVTVFYGQVLLTGQVPSETIKNTASNIVKSESGVDVLFNELTLAGPSSTLTRMSDSWISTKLKMHLLSIKDLQTSEVSITVNNGIVYIMGHHLDSLQASWVAQAARKVDGVQKVVLCGDALLPPKI